MTGAEAAGHPVAREVAEPEPANRLGLYPSPVVPTHCRSSVQRADTVGGNEVLFCSPSWIHCSVDRGVLKRHNDASVTFAQSMLPDHQQAIAMAMLVIDHGANVECAPWPTRSATSEHQRSANFGRCSKRGENQPPWPDGKDGPRNRRHGRC